MAVQFSHPTMLVTLGNDGDDVVLSEAQFVIVPPLKVDYGPSASTFPFRDGKENLLVSRMTLDGEIGVQVHL